MTSDEFIVGDVVWMYDQSRRENKVTRKYSSNRTGPMVVLEVKQKTKNARVQDVNIGYVAVCKEF